MNFVLEDESDETIPNEDAKVPLKGENEKKKGKCKTFTALSTLQWSSFAFLPAAVVTLARALTGTRLLLSHAWTCGVFSLSVANHSRDYHDGPSWDALDAVDKVFAWSLGVSCVFDGFVHLSGWRLLTSSSLGLATLALYSATRLLKTTAATDSSPAAALHRLHAIITPKTLHVCMHIAAGTGALLVVA